MAILPTPQPYQPDYDPSLRPVTCEAPGCDLTKPLNQMVSYVITRALSGNLTDASGKCPAEQHYGCCDAHAKLVAHACLDEHFPAD